MVATQLQCFTIIISFLGIECQSNTTFVNIALGKNATQSGTYHTLETFNGANNAVDGNTDPDTAQGHCSHTKQTEKAWWTVDFGKASLVGSLKIYNRQSDPSYKRLHNFYVYVQNMTEGSKQSLCYHYKDIVPQGKRNMSPPARPRALIFCAKQLVGRYLTIQKADNITGYLTLCEVEVYEKWINSCASSPCQHGATCTDMSTGYTCKCEDGYIGIHCETDIDECASNPCANGGSCTNRVNGFTCTCLTGYAGTRCDTDRKECASNPCQNGGTCKEQQLGAFTCQCVQEYTGTQCQTDIDECASSHCLNGATCENKLNSYTCKCVAGFTGIRCETNIDECASSPCENGASCMDKILHYTCVCPRGYLGTRCETDIDECVSIPCLNGATCTDGIQGYTCRCTYGYTGTYCETEIKPCASNPCQNGGTCLENLTAYTCSCPQGFRGIQCTEIKPCASNPCQNGGTCVERLPGYACTCTLGYTDTHCQTDIDECASSPCQNGGKCSEGIGTYQCKCAFPYTGLQCDSVLMAVIAAIAAATLIVVVILVIVCFCRRKNKEKNKDHGASVAYFHQHHAENEYTTAEDVSLAGGHPFIVSATPNESRAVMVDDGSIADMYASVTKPERRPTSNDPTVDEDNIAELYAVPNKAKKEKTVMEGADASSNSKPQKPPIAPKKPGLGLKVTAKGAAVPNAISREPAKAIDQEKVDVHFATTVDVSDAEYEHVWKAGNTHRLLERESSEESSVSNESLNDPNAAEYAVVIKHKKKEEYADNARKDFQDTKDNGTYDYANTIDSDHNRMPLHNQPQDIYSNAIY